MEKARVRYEASFTRRMVRVRNEVIRKAAGSYQAGQLPERTLKDLHAMRTAQVFQGEYKRIIPVFGEMALEDLKGYTPEGMETKQSDSFFQTLIAQWIAEYGLEESVLVQQVSETTIEDINRAIAAGVAAGEGQETIRRRIQDVRALSNFRAATIARTEVHNAASFANIETIRNLNKETGLVTYKQWVAIEDSRTRSGHMEMDGKPAIPEDEKFQVRANESSPYEAMDRPGDPSASAANVVNCRCALIHTSPEISFD